MGLVVGSGKWRVRAAKGPMAGLAHLLPGYIAVSLTPAEQGNSNLQRRLRFDMSSPQPLTILFLHGWRSVVGGVKPSYLQQCGIESSILRWMMMTLQKRVRLDKKHSIGFGPM